MFYSVDNLHKSKPASGWRKDAEMWVGVVLLRRYGVNLYKDHMSMNSMERFALLIQDIMMEVAPYDLFDGTLELHKILISRMGILKGCP